MQLGTRRDGIMACKSGMQLTRARFGRRRHVRFSLAAISFERRRKKNKEEEEGNPGISPNNSQPARATGSSATHFLMFIIALFSFSVFACFGRQGKDTHGAEIVAVAVVVVTSINPISSDDSYMCCSFYESHRS